MGITDRFYNWLDSAVKRRKRKNERRAATLLKAIGGEGRYAYEPMYAMTSNQQKAYQAVSWVYIAISRMAKGVGMVPFEVQKPRPGENNFWDPVYNHPFIELLEKPNDEMGRLELWESTVGYLYLTGNCFWFVSGGPGSPTRIQVLRSDRMAVVPDDSGKGMVKGYVYEVDGVKIPLDPVEIVHFKLFHPSNDYYGLSPLEAAAVAAQSDFAQAQWNANFFGKEAAVPAGMVVLKGTVTPGDFARFKDDWNESYGGSERKTAIVRGGDVDWKNIGLSQKEMEFLKSRKFNKQEIFDIYDIPLGATDPSSTEANSVTGLNYFKEYTIWPICTRLGEKITQDVLPFWSGKLRGRFKDIRPIDRQLEITEGAHKRAIRTFNEARELEGLEPLSEEIFSGLGLPDSIILGKLPFATVGGLTLTELLAPSTAEADQEAAASLAKTQTDANGDRERPSRAQTIDDNPANKPKKQRQGMAAKPEKATKDLYITPGPVPPGYELEVEEVTEPGDEYRSYRPTGKVVPTSGPEIKGDLTLQAIEDLRTFRKFYIKRFKAGKSMADVRQFESEHLANVLPSLYGLLAKAQTTDEIHVIFDDAPYLLDQ